MTWYEREADELERQLEEGLIGNREFNEEMAELDRDARAGLREQAERAYDDVMEGGEWSL